MLLRTHTQILLFHSLFANLIDKIGGNSRNLMPLFTLIGFLQMKAKGASF